MIRSDHPEYTRSRPISEVKLDWAGPVLWTEMTREAPVTNLLPGDDMVKGPSHNFRNHEIQFDFLYEWQGRPPHERLPGHLARFRQLVCCVVSMSCIFLHDIRYHSVEEYFNTKAYVTFIRWAISTMV